MKKLTFFALAFALCTACAVSALAADATSGTMNPTSGATEITTSIKPLRISFSTKGENSTRGTASARGGSARHKKRRGGSRSRHRPCRFWVIQQKRVCDILDATDSWCAVQDSNL